MKFPARRVALIAGLATIIGLIYPAQNYFAFTGRTDTFPWKEQLVQSMSTWYLWGLFFPDRKSVV